MTDADALSMLLLRELVKANPVLAKYIHELTDEELALLRECAANDNGREPH
jgi:hypothetical protein